jgi:PBP1b-binding outer membrane lipoprotein LpoB
MRSILLFILLVIIFSGCTPPAFVQEKNNVKQEVPTISVPDKTEKKDYDSTLSDCEFEASQNPDYDNGLMGRLKSKNYIKGCLSSRGWVLRDN